MQNIVWNENLNTGIAEIDAQHQMLVQIINTLGDAVHQGRGRDSAGRILNRLAQYAEHHFSTEATHMPDTPLSKAHLEEHASFIEKISVFQGEFAAGRADVDTALMSFLAEWLTQHILRSDRTLD